MQKAKLKITIQNSKLPGLLALLIILLLAGYFVANKLTRKKNISREDVSQEISQISEESVDSVDIPPVKEAMPEASLPNKFLIKNVPFTVQAPFGRWDEIHEEACEEASIVMLEYFKKNKKITPEIAEKEIQGLVAYQIKTRSDFKDSNADQIAKLARDYYGLELEVVRNFKKEDLKEYLAEKKPIIIPAAGRLLRNPFFTSPGPLYHNLVLVGYDEKNFFTNDPGTKRGQNYRYEQDVLWNAIHDFTGEKKDILKGQKAVLVLK